MTTPSPTLLILKYSDAPDDPDARYQKLERLLAAPPELSLDLRIDVMCGKDFDEQEFSARCESIFGTHTEEANDLIVENAHRFRTLDLPYAPFAGALNTAGTARLNMPRLEHLVLDITNALSTNPIAPHLRTLVAGHIAYARTLFTDYPNLERLELCADTVEGAGSVFPEGPPPHSIQLIVIWNHDSNMGIGEVPRSIFEVPSGATVRFYCANESAVQAARDGCIEFAGTDHSISPRDKHALIEYGDGCACEVHAPHRMLDGLFR